MNVQRGLAPGEMGERVMKVWVAIADSQDGDHTIVVFATRALAIEGVMGWVGEDAADADELADWLGDLEESISAW